MATSQQDAVRQSAKFTRRAFGVMGLAALAGVAGWEWFWSGEGDDDIAPRARKVLEFNEQVTGKALFGKDHLAPEFSPERAGTPRANGDEGLDGPMPGSEWRLQLTSYSGAKRLLTMDAIRRLPKVEHTTEFKCIEGWSKIVRWGGVRFADFTAAYAPGSERARYASLQTPNAEYYVGNDMPSMLHPQTLLAYEMNGQPLSNDHGAPLRLVIPVKYGIKNLKRIGQITYTDSRPADYWAERGYDYYAAL